MTKTGIAGATGQLGRLVVEKLKEKGKADQLVALVRSPEKAADMGIPAKRFDYTQPDTLIDALQGIDHLLLISSNEIGQRKVHHQNVIEAAKKAGVKWIVYTSLLHADTSTLSLAGEHVETERLLQASGIPHTILRNGWYTENYTGSLSGALASGVLAGSAGDGRISSATRADFAEAAAVVLNEEGHAGKVYELAGDESYTLKDLAAEVSRQTGKNISYNDLPESEYASALSKMGVPDRFAQALAGFDAEASKNQLFNDKKTLSQLIGRPTTPLSEAVKAALK